MATPKIIADFESQLSTAIAVGGTSFSLNSATDDDGVALPNGLYYFTVDNGTSNKEYLAGTLAGTSVTGVLTVARQGGETSGAAKAHRVGASVIMTDFATYKKYMDEIANAGASDADISTKGLFESATTAEIDADTATGSTGAELAVTPDKLVLSKYGTLLPTSDEKAALVGAGATPDTSNKYLTEGDVSDVTLFPIAQHVAFTSSGTWTKDTGLKYIIVELVGGGGGSEGAYEGGGGSGGYSRKIITAGSLGATETVTVGTGGASSGGATGGTTTFGAHATGGGGVGTTTRDGGAGGAASGGDFNSSGQQGGGGDVSEAIIGVGANSQLGSYGKGGNSAQAGSAGYVLVTEYYS